MTTPQHRINEFKKRQVMYFKNIVIKLSNTQINPTYSIWHWNREDNRKSLLHTGPYHDEDPKILIERLGIVAK